MNVQAHGVIDAAAIPAGGRRDPLRVVDRVAEAVVVVALLVELCLVLANVLARVYLHHSFLWADEAARLALSILAFIGGAVAYRRRDHAFVSLVLNLLPRRIGQGFLAFADILVVFVVAVTGIASAEFIASSWGERTPILQLPAALIALPLPVGMALIALFALSHLWREHRGMALWVAGGFAVVMVAAAMTRNTWLPLLGGDAAIVVALTLFFVAILAGVPVGFVLLLATATYLWASDAASMVVLPQTMVNGTGNFILLAVPFFILAGLIMERGGISVRLVRFIHALVGHMRGGLLQVTVVSMYIVSGLSGSKPADVAAVGTVMRDQLRERHGAAEGAAVLAASAIMGETVPPSIAMLIVGSITSVSVAAMFIGGLIPAAVMALCLMAMIYVRARRDGTPRMPRAPFGVIARAGLEMDRRAFLKTGVGAAGLALAAPYVARGAGPMTLRWAHFAQEDHPANIAAKQFAANVEKRTSGAIKINIFPNNVLGGPPEQAQQIKLGTIDMGLPTQGQLDKYDTAFAAVPLPFIWEDSAHVFRVLDGPAMEWLSPLAEKQGFILLHNWEYGFRNVTNTVRPINTPDDVKGLKLRTPPELQIQAALEAVGAVVQAIAFPELYLALSQKVVDGEENPIAVIYYNKFYEVQKYLAITRHVYNNMIHTIGVNTWKKLSPAQQAIFREESATAGNLMRKMIGDQEADQIKKIEAAGMQVTRPDLAPFRAKMEPAYKRIADYAGADNVKKFRELVEHGRKA